MSNDIDGLLMGDPEERLGIRRDQWGRPLIIPPGGGKPNGYTRASTLGKALEDPSALTGWAKRQVGRGVAIRPDLQAGFSTIDPDDPDGKKELNKLAEKAMEAVASSSKATLGTALHALTEKYDRGERGFHVPPALVDDLRAYVAATEGIRWAGIEKFVVCDEIEAAGTFDRLGDLSAWGVGGPPLKIFDVKTGRVDYGEVSMPVQFATYAHGAEYDPKTGARTPLGDVDLKTAYVIHLPVGKADCTIIPVDLELGWENAKLARTVLNARKVARKRAFGSPVTRPTAPAAPVSLEADLLRRILECSSVEALMALWQETGGSWSERHGKAAAQRKAELS